MEARGSRLATAEESSSKSADALDHTASRRRTDIEAAVRRLQAELQHALDIERSRNAEAAASRDAAAAAAAAARGAAASSARAAKEIEENRQQSEASKVSASPPVVIPDSYILDTVHIHKPESAMKGKNPNMYCYEVSSSSS